MSGLSDAEITDPLAAQIAAVLGEHDEFDVYNHETWVCDCGKFKFPCEGDAYEAHRAHVAQILAELVGGDGLCDDDRAAWQQEIDELRADVEMWKQIAATKGGGLRAGVAAAWFAGYDKGNLDGYFGTSDERRKSPYADLDPYDEHGNLRALLDQRGEGEK